MHVLFKCNVGFNTILPNKDGKICDLHVVFTYNERDCVITLHKKTKDPGLIHFFPHYVFMLKTL